VNQELSKLEHPLRTTAIVGFLFFGGMALGVIAVLVLVPANAIAVFIGFLALPLSFGLGMSMWYSVANADMLQKVGRALVQSMRSGNLSESIRDELRSFYQSPVQGTRVFLPVTLIITFACGVIIACLPNVPNMDAVVVAFLTLGLGYSLLVTWLARQGYLPQPRCS
jgi:hypothetical protein